MEEANKSSALNQSNSTGHHNKMEGGRLEEASANHNNNSNNGGGIGVAGGSGRFSQLLRKEPIQIVRGNGRIITLPPIEAPTTRAKRRAQTTQTTQSLASETGNKSNVNMVESVGIMNESSTDVSMQSPISTGSIANGGGVGIRDRQNSRESVVSGCSAVTTTFLSSSRSSQRRSNNPNHRSRRSKRVSSNRSHTETESVPSNDETDHTSKKDDDDPNK